MKKRVFVLIAIIAMLFGSTVVAYSYWDNLQQNSTGEYNIGYGVRLEVPARTEDDRSLVPAGSFYSAYEEEYTTAFTFEYVLSLEDDLQEGMLSNLVVDITDFDINNVLTSFNHKDSLLSVTVATDEAAGYASDTGEWVFEDAFYFEKNVVSVSVTIQLADNGNTSFNAADYGLVAGQAADFEIGFELVNNSSSTKVVPVV